MVPCLFPLCFDRASLSRYIRFQLNERKDRTRQQTQQHKLWTTRSTHINNVNNRKVITPLCQCFTARHRLKSSHALKTISHHIVDENFSELKRLKIVIWSKHPCQERPVRQCWMCFAHRNFGVLGLFYLCVCVCVWLRVDKTNMVYWPTDQSRGLADTATHRVMPLVWLKIHIFLVPRLPYMWLLGDPACVISFC